MTCPVCHKPEPADWCWIGNFYCPLDKPPRYLDVQMLWWQIRKLTEWITALEGRTPQ